MNEMAYVVQAWLPLIIWQQVDAPQYRTGFISASCIAWLMIATVLTTRYLWKRELRRYDNPFGRAKEDAQES
jgi:ACS family pantothenate transporter-like MFS transporter